VALRKASSPIIWIAATLLVAAVAIIGGVRLADRRVWATIGEQAASDARLRANLLNSELTRFRLLPAALADDRDVVATTDAPARPGSALDRKLEALAGVTGAPVLYVLRSDGLAIAASNWRSNRSFVGTSYAFRPYFSEALANGQGAQYALGIVSGKPGLFISRRAAGHRVIVIKLEFDRIEDEWRGAGGVTYVRDGQGVVLVTSRPDWRFATSRPLTQGQELRYRAQTRTPTQPLSPLPVMMEAHGARARIGDAQYAVADAATVQAGWRLIVLREAGPALAAARLAAALGAGLAVIAVSAILWILRQRAVIARVRTTELERAVAESTAYLRREMDERAALEARAADLREGLRQANRLATLGQVTASVAHETAQPLGAIRTYVESTDLLLERGDVAEARGNLAAIVRLVDRIRTTTEELRGFARRAPGNDRAISLAAVTDGATLILKEQLRRIRFDIDPIDPQLKVLGGRIRLEQVLVNLLQNALDALKGHDDPYIAVRVTVLADRVRIAVADNGPGIAPDIGERLFTPFVTSRPDGLGLGLVIAHDIMVEAGGSLRLASATRGATFEMEVLRV
jgi:two-component system, NtrC family, C4-dicarboxylate transport sensor histidine kinase DctB